MTPPSIAAIVLAAGSSTRMPGGHKLLERVHGRSLVASAVGAALTFGADPVVVVTGHQASDVHAALPEGVLVVHNRAYTDGLASSLRIGIQALPPRIDAVIVSLADMPLVRARHFETLARAWRAGTIVVPVRGGRRGNPVLWSTDFFGEMCELAGDRGAKSIMDLHPEALIEVPTEDEAVFVDVDDADDLERVRGLG